MRDNLTPVSGANHDGYRPRVEGAFQRQPLSSGALQHATSYAKGVDAEALAVDALERKGFEVLDRRYRTPAGELDLVVACRNSLAFVEVKRRRSYAEASEAITCRQQMRMAGAAEIWLQRHPEYADCDITFDAVLIAPRAAPQHIPDAFRPAA